MGGKVGPPKADCHNFWGSWQRTTSRTTVIDPPTPVGLALIRRGDRFLVRRRPEGTVYAGYWEFPGGKCEPGEDAAAAAARECFEEIGMRVVVGPLRHTTVHRYAHGEVELFFFDCRTEDESAEPADGTGFCWVMAAELPTLRFPEANEMVLQQLAAGAGVAGSPARQPTGTEARPTEKGLKRHQWRGRPCPRRNSPHGIAFGLGRNGGARLTTLSIRP